MGAKRPRFRNVITHVHLVRPDLENPESAIAEGRLVVAGRPVTNPRSLVPADGPVRVDEVRPLRGEEKLRAALDTFQVDVTGSVCLDVGAAAGGFTRVLLERGASKVFAIDAGHGQLREDLRTHSRVVNMERTNVAMAPSRIPRCLPIDLVTIDLSYLAVAEAVGQLEGLRFAAGSGIVALVKPMFELGLARPPDDERSLRRALDLAIRGTERQPWRVLGAMPSPVTGAGGAREWLIYGRRR